MDIIEFTFENVRKRALIDFFTFLTDFQLINVNTSYKCDNFSDMVNLGEDGVINLFFHHVKINDIELTQPLFNIVIFSDEIQVNIQVEEENIMSMTLDKLKRIAENFSEKLMTKQYFCGLEPAIDKNTQFFSYISDGSLNWK